LISGAVGVDCWLACGALSAAEACVGAGGFGDTAGLAGAGADDLAGAGEAATWLFAGTATGARAEPLAGAVAGAVAEGAADSFDGSTNDCLGAPAGAGNEKDGIIPPAGLLSGAGAAEVNFWPVIPPPRGDEGPKGEGAASNLVGVEEGAVKPNSGCFAGAGIAVASLEAVADVPKEFTPPNPKDGVPGIPKEGAPEPNGLAEGCLAAGFASGAVAGGFEGAGAGAEARVGVGREEADEAATPAPVPVAVGRGCGAGSG
jgi:hypothetical protein